MKSAAILSYGGLKKHIGLVVHRLVDIVLPGQCVICTRATQVAGLLCSDCWGKLSFIEAPVCDRMGTPFAFDPGAGIVSASALAKPPLWQRARAGVEFDEIARKLVHGLKYHDRMDLGEFMAATMVRAGRELLDDADMIVPVPLHATRLWWRRFNQAGLLGQIIAAKSGVPVRTDLLLRSRATRQQVGLKGAARFKNVRKAFAVSSQKQGDVLGKCVVVVDDVRTTGATLSACVKALLDGGARQVDVLTFALVNNQTSSHI